MRRVWFAAFVTIMASLWGFTNAAVAQQGLTVGANAIFYGDNTEFRNPFREGETIFGAAVRLDARVEITEAVTLSLGVFGNQRFGGEASFDLVRPVLALTVRGKRSSFVLGTLPGPFDSGDGLLLDMPSGPDRTGPHRLLPPLQRETLAFERAYEAGLQWTFHGERLEHETWLHWQRLNTPAHRERLDAGSRGAWRICGPVSLPFQTHIVHEGGQSFAAGPVRDSFGLASGVVLSNGSKTRSSGQLPSPKLDVESLVLTLELLGLWSRYTPDRVVRNPTRHGGAFFGRVAVEKRAWRGHLIMWRGDDFIKDEGDPNYMSRRRNGTRYRGVRDYAEAGMTRTFKLAPAAMIESSFRFHRVERHYEYSYRVLAVADVRGRLK